MPVALHAREDRRYHMCQFDQEEHANMSEKQHKDPSSDRDQELSLKLLVVLSKAYKVIIEQTTRDMRHYGLSPSEFSALELLYNKGSYPLQQIAGKVLLTSGSITYVADKLEEKGYLRRKPSKEDRRVIFAEITDKGIQLFDDIFPSHAAAVQQIMSGLDTEEKAAAITLIKKLGLYAQQTSTSGK